MLFVLPHFIGTKIRKKLVHHSLEKAKNLDCNSVTLLVDLNATAFYENQGFL